MLVCSCVIAPLDSLRYGTVLALTCDICLLTVRLCSSCIINLSFSSFIRVDLSGTTSLQPSCFLFAWVIAVCSNLANSVGTPSSRVIGQRPTTQKHPERHNNLTNTTSLLPLTMFQRRTSAGCRYHHSGTRQLSINAKKSAWIK